jgi:hypothetical protein
MTDHTNGSVPSFETTLYRGSVAALVGITVGVTTAAVAWWWLR